MIHDQTATGPETNMAAEKNRALEDDRFLPGEVPCDFKCNRYKRYDSHVSPSRSIKLPSLPKCPNATEAPRFSMVSTGRFCRQVG